MPKTTPASPPATAATRLLLAAAGATAAGNAVLAARPSGHPLTQVRSCSLALAPASPITPHCQPGKDALNLWHWTFIGRISVHFHACIKNNGCMCRKCFIWKGANLLPVYPRLYRCLYIFVHVDTYIFIYLNKPVYSHWVIDWVTHWLIIHDSSIPLFIKYE